MISQTVQELPRSRALTNKQTYTHKSILKTISPPITARVVNIKTLMMC